MVSVKRTRSRRSFILTVEGLDKLNSAMRESATQAGLGGKGYSREKLSEFTGLGIDTLRKVLRGEEPVDESSIKAFEEPFHLVLLEGVDYTKPELPSSTVSKKPNRDRLRQRPKIRLPRQTNDFIGRSIELQQLLEHISLAYRAPIITVDGIGGVGKTALVLEAAYLCLEASVYGESPLNAPIFDSIIFTSAKEDDLFPAGIVSQDRSQIHSTLRDIFRVIANTLEDQAITQASPEDQLDRVYESLGEQSTLLIVDNFETIQDKDQVIRFLSRLPPSVKGLITTREQVVLFGCMRLDCLPEDDSLRLVQQQAAEKNITLSKEESKQLYDRFGGVPVALIYIIGRLASGYSLETVLEPSNSLPEDIARFCFEHSVQPFRGQPIHNVLVSLAIFRRGPSRDAVAAVAGLKTDPFALEKALAQLQQLSLVSFQNQRYRMLPLTREYALAELAIHSDFEREARERWVNWYLDFAQKYGGKDWEEWNLQYDPLVVEWQNLRAVLHWCAEQERYVDVKNLWRDLDQVASLQGYWEDRLAWLEWLLEASERRGDSKTAVEVMSEHSYTLILMGKLEKAEKLLLEGWNIRTCATLESQAFLAQQFALLRIQQKRYHKAHLWLNKEENIVNQANFSAKEMERRKLAVLSFRAEIYYKTGEYNQAQSIYEEIIQRAEAIGWRRRKYATQIWLADIEMRKGNLKAAEKLLKTGLPVAKRNNAKETIAHYQSSFARLEKVRGNVEEACKWATQAIEGFDRLGMIPEVKEMRSLYAGCSGTSVS
ncbi:MAG: ATP-binding protein [Cyanothece sp. SIO1E1]|nr:ATP-binding protein [Cyanothece sp. SIO1E1]